MNYIINNFTDAPNFKDHITEKLTDSQKEEIIKSGPVIGCSKLIKMKCIQNKNANERSIHCIDTSRKKFMIRMDNNWQIDMKGKKMLTISIPLLRARSLESKAFYGIPLLRARSLESKAFYGIPITKEIFEKDFDFDNINDPYMKSAIIRKLLELEHKSCNFKIINDVGDAY